MCSIRFNFPNSIYKYTKRNYINSYFAILAHVIHHVRVGGFISISDVRNNRFIWLANSTCFTFAVISNVFFLLFIRWLNKRTIRKWKIRRFLNLNWYCDQTSIGSSIVKIKLISASSNNFQKPTPRLTWSSNIWYSYRKWKYKKNRKSQDSNSRIINDSIYIQSKMLITLVDYWIIFIFFSLSCHHHCISRLVNKRFKKWNVVTFLIKGSKIKTAISWDFHSKKLIWMRPIRFKCEFYVFSPYISLSENVLRDFIQIVYIPFELPKIKENHEGNNEKIFLVDFFCFFLWFKVEVLILTEWFPFLPITRKCLYSSIYVWWGKIHQKKKCVRSCVYTNRRMFLIACYLCSNLRRV